MHFQRGLYTILGSWETRAVNIRDVNDLKSLNSDIRQDVSSCKSDLNNDEEKHSDTIKYHQNNIISNENTLQNL